MRSPTERGVTLLECVAAIAIVGTAVVAGLEMFGSHQVVAAGEEWAWEALRYLGSEAERVRVEDYEQLQTTTFAPLAENPNYEIRYVVDQTSASCRRVTIEVRWTALSGLYDRRSLVAFRCEGVN